MARAGGAGHLGLAGPQKNTGDRGRRRYLPRRRRTDTGIHHFSLPKVIIIPADHYLYMPMLGISLIAGELARRYKNAAVKIGIVVILAVVTIVQTGYWRDDRSLFSHAIQINPQCDGPSQSRGRRPA